MGQLRPLYNLFAVFLNQIVNFLQQINVNPTLGFKLMTSLS